MTPLDFSLESRRGFLGSTLMEAPPQYPGIRVCAVEGCGRVLSTYNGRQHCYFHDHTLDHGEPRQYWHDLG